MLFRLISSIFLLLSCNVAAFAEPNDAVINCTTPDSKLSAMVIRTKSCVRTSVAFPNYDPSDSYHQLLVIVSPEPDFDNGTTIKKGAGASDILKSVVNELFKVSKPRSLFLSLEISDGIVHEPILTPISFKYDDAQRSYTSDITLNSTSMLHRLDAGSSLRVKLKAFYSDNVSFDPSAVTRAVAPAFGSTDFLVSSATKPFLEVARAGIAAALNLNGTTFDASTTIGFSPAIGSSTREELLVVDPKNPARKIATITLQLVSTRSLLATPHNFEDGANTLPVVPTDGGSIDLSLIGKKVVIGQASAWPLPVVAVASATTSELPATATAIDVKRFCRAVLSNLGNQFSLSGLDRTIIAGKAVEIAIGGSSERKFNPYKACFSAGELAILEKYLPSLDLSDPATPDLNALGPISDPAKFEALGCWLKGTAGDQCGSLPAMHKRLEGYLGEFVTLSTLEGVDGVPELFEGLPDTREINRQSFLDRFAGRFARFHDYSLGSGIMLVNVTANSPDLVLRGKVKDGRIVAISIQRN